MERKIGAQKKGKSERKTAPPPQKKGRKKKDQKDARPSSMVLSHDHAEFPSGRPPQNGRPRDEY